MENNENPKEVVHQKINATKIFAVCISCAPVESKFEYIYIIANF